jgi:hypothetical protein
LHIFGNCKANFIKVTLHVGTEKRNAGHASHIKRYLGARRTLRPHNSPSFRHPSPPCIHEKYLEVSCGFSDVYLETQLENKLI